MKKPQARKLSGASGSSSAAARRASGWASGTYSEPASSVRASVCQWPFTAIIVRPSKVPGLAFASSARKVFTFMPGFAAASVVKSTPCATSRSATGAA